MRRALSLSLLVLSLSLTACAGVGAAGTRVASPSFDAPMPAAAASRLGPPSLRGIGLRRVDRPAAALPPLALR